MADSARLRQRRYEWHGKGDHSLCRPERCSAAKLAATPPEPPPLPPGTLVADAVEAVLTAVTFRNDSDRRLVHAAIARRIAVELDSAACGAHGLTELSIHLQWLVDLIGEPDPDPVTMLEAASAAKLAGSLLQSMRHPN